MAETGVIFVRTDDCAPRGGRQRCCTRPPRSQARWVPRGRIGFGCLSWLRSMPAWPIRATVVLAAEPVTTGCPTGSSPLEVVNTYTGSRRHRSDVPVAPFPADPDPQM